MKTKKLAIKYGLTVIIFCAVFVVAGAIKAGVAENITGWLWGGSDDGAGNSTGVGWISMNNTNTAGGSSYGVNIPSVDGDISGTAWSENMGYIAFDNVNSYLNGCPSGSCVAERVGNNIQGWARFVEIAKASATGNSGGWSGWIALNDKNTGDGINYGVSIASDGKLSGNAWSDELGYIKFSGTAGDRSTYGASLPSVTFSSRTPLINIKTYPDWKTAGIADIILDWGITGNTSCTKIWDLGTVNSTGNSAPINQAETSNTYKLQCTNGVGEKSTTVTTACYPQACASQKCVDVSIPITGVSDISTCTNASSCTTDADCETRSVNTWKEVAP